MVMGKDDGFEYPPSHQFFKGGIVKNDSKPEKKEPTLWLEGFHRTGQWVRICELGPREDTEKMMRNINSKRQPFWTKVHIDFDAFDAWRTTPYYDFKWML